MNTVQICENGLEATRVIDELLSQGYIHDNIYIFAHGERRSNDLTDATNTASVGLEEQGFFDAVQNVFRTRGDELRAKFEAVGLTAEEAERYESVLDTGKLVVVANR
ncbi:general stress protein [Lederbergia graminis]|uniref:General stress protein n=1 Tax=Lederbergia graminis TaxID=735518 RepID=A0ABW0LL19_9BACI|nr:general stress protein [Paenibacillus bovis]HLU21805.1 general stress protein [Bacillaceae bacterium]